LVNFRDPEISLDTVGGVIVKGRLATFWFLFMSAVKARKGRGHPYACCLRDQRLNPET
jgi:hypothetical protein